MSKLNPYIDRLTYQEREYVNIMCITPKQFELIKAVIELEVTRQQLQLSHRTDEEKEIYKLDIEDLKQIEKILT